MTSLTLTNATPDEVDADVLVVLISEADPCTCLVAADTLPATARAALAEAATALATHSRGSQPTVVPAPAGFASNTVLFAPVDDPADLESLRRAVGAAVLPLETHVVAVCPSNADPEVISAVGTGALLGCYRIPRPTRTEVDRRAAGPTQILVPLGTTASEEQLAAAREANVVSRSVLTARDLVNLPPNLLYPEAMATRALEFLADAPVEVSTLGPTELQAGGYGGLIGVGQGSQRGPRLIQLTYTPASRALTPEQSVDTLEHVALVGKGITFDSGGLSIKPAKSMETMKSDMGGSAAVLATLRLAADLNLPIKVTGWLACAENMPSGSAQRPGDVITIRGGKTVEVLNTDAEGRLVLADAIVRAGEDGPSVIVDVATLTGAQMVALGTRVCGVMANSDELRAELVSAADRSGELAWPMPLPTDLRASLDSPVADLANIGDRNGGMLSAGIFLSEFVPEGTPWAHLDIAGPAFNAGPAHGYTSKGGTGFAVATLAEFLRQRAKSAS